jgi:hypothetical protein
MMIAAMFDYWPACLIDAPTVSIRSQRMVSQQGFDSRPNFFLSDRVIKCSKVHALAVKESQVQSASPWQCRTKKIFIIVKHDLLLTLLRSYHLITIN